MAGRGFLGKWGPNLAVDPLVVSWEEGTPHTRKFHKGQRILQVVVIERRDKAGLALPGGMFEGGDARDEAIREFCEEALSTSSREDVKKEFLKRENAINLGWFHVKDHRETDNSWIETEAFCFYLSPDQFKKLKKMLHSGTLQPNMTCFCGLMDD